MYYLIYGLLYLFSLLPFPVLYFISNGLYGLVYYIIGYRKKVVMQNLAIAFPKKTEAERKEITKQFYKNFIDSFMENIKMISISEKEFNRRCTMDITPINGVAAKGKNIHIFTAHLMNWEYANWMISKNINLPWVAVYMLIKNKALNRVFFNIRTKYKAVMIPAQQFKTKMHGIFKSRYSLGIVADQNPASPGSGYWLYFFSKPVPFLIGPEKGARMNKAAVIFICPVKSKRGYYHVESKLITENAAELKEGELTCLYRDYLEEKISINPDNYLWSHRRWKWEYKNEFKRGWIDKRANSPVME